MFMKKVITVIVLVSVSLIFFGVFPGIGAEAGADDEKSDFPSYGFGAQFVAPLGGISSRVWISPKFGLEGDAVIWRSRWRGVGGMISSRVLYKVIDRDVADFYLAGGAGYDISSEKISGMGTGGISIELFSSSFKVNLEFGMQVQSDGYFNMSFGSGFHYYL